MKALGAKYFLSRALAAHLLDCNTEEIKDLFACNLAANYGFSENKLQDALLEQDQLDCEYRLGFLMSPSGAVFAELSASEIDDLAVREKFEQAFANYILSNAA